MDVQAHLELITAPVALARGAARWGDRPRYHVRDEAQTQWTPVSWRAHADAMMAVAAWLLESVGEGPGFGAIFAPNGHRWMEAALGLQAARLAMVPIYPASTPDQAGYVLRHSEAKVACVATPELLGRLLRNWSACEGLQALVVLDDTDPHAVARSLAAEGVDVPAPDELERKLVHWSQVMGQGAALHAAAPSRVETTMAAADPHEPAIMLYTSGTTGRPKGVPLTHHNVGVNGRDWLVALAEGLPDEGIDVLWLPMSHIFGFGEACFGNRLGWTSWLSSPAEVFDVVTEVRPTVFMSVPAYWEKLAATALAASTPEAARAAVTAATGGRLQFCLSGGAGLARAVKEVFVAAGAPIIEGYGLTETSPTLTINRPDDFRVDAVGKPLPSVELRLADDGEILARGPSVFGGYHHDEAATAAAFTADGWFQTGDLGRMTDDGFLQIVGRKKEILVTAAGKNVPPANLEARFSHEPLFAHVVAYGDGKKYLVAGVWLDESVVAERLAALGHAVDDPQARRALVEPHMEAANAELARFEQIKRFGIMSRPLTVADGMLTSTLKLRRAKVYEAFASEFEAIYT
jgi:long-chain acyl-CoA synthetase